MFPIPFLVHYSATKAFNDLFSRGLSIENLDKNLDIMSLTPVYVVTNILEFMVNIPFLSINPE